jgi:hypothetical protein
MTADGGAPAALVSDMSNYSLLISMLALHTHAKPPHPATSDNTQAGPNGAADR